MKTLELAKIAAREIEEFKKNDSVMRLVKREALEKVAGELQDEGYSCTFKAVDILCVRHKNIAERVEKYIDSGLLGCLMAKYSKAA